MIPFSAPSCRRAAWRRLPALGLLLSTAIAAPPSTAASEVVERRVWAMGTMLEVAVTAADRATALRATEAALEAVATVEDLLSNWRPESWVSRWNARPPYDRPAPPAEVRGWLAEAERCRRVSDGAFDPMLPAPAAAPGTRRLDTGGFGKGAALDLARRRLEALPGVRSAGFDFGGQLAFFDREPEARAITVAHPERRDEGAASLQLPARIWISAATSGSSERGAHIVDPRTGGAAADFGSVTVVAESALWADCLSTGLFVLGPERARAFARRRSDVDVLVLERSIDRRGAQDVGELNASGLDRRREATFPLGPPAPITSGESR